MYKHFITIFLILLTSFACKKLGYDADPNNDISNGNYQSDTLYAIADSVIEKGTAYTGFSSKFVLGQRDGLQAGFLVYFSFLETFSDIDSVSLEFTTVNSYGADMVDEISSAIYSVDSSWGLAANQYNRYRDPPVEKMEFVTSGILKTKDSTISKISIPLNFSNNWIGLTADSLADTVTFNLYLEPETGNENAIVELGSYLSLQAPVLIYHKIFEDSSVTDTVDAIVGATLFNYNEETGTALNYPNEMVIISSGIIRHSLFKFDFNQLPEDAIYYRASFVLTEDDINEYENSDNKSSLELKTVESFADSVYNPNLGFSMISEDGLTKTSGASSIALGENFIQFLANNDIENEWLEVEFVNEDRDFSIKRFWGIDNADPQKRPKIIINYLNASK